MVCASTIAVLTPGWEAIFRPARVPNWRFNEGGQHWRKHATLGCDYTRVFLCYTFSAFVSEKCAFVHASEHFERRQRRTSSERAKMANRVASARRIVTLLNTAAAPGVRRGRHA